MCICDSGVIFFGQNDVSVSKMCICNHLNNLKLNVYLEMLCIFDSGMYLFLVICKKIYYLVTCFLFIQLKASFLVLFLKIYFLLV